MSVHQSGAFQPPRPPHSPPPTSRLMPKLHLKETKDDKEDKELRRLRKAARKAAKYARYEDEEPPARKRAKYDYVFDEDGWTPPVSSSKADEEEIRARMEEEEFNAKLFDAMGMDERLENTEAFFNSYVPPRWRNEEEDSISGVQNLHELNDDEYAEYLRRGMWERTHRAEIEEQKRRQKEYSERKRKEKELKEKGRQMEREEKEKRRKREGEKAKRKFVESWDAYQTRWAELQTIKPSPNSLSFQDLPWPVHPPPSSVEDLSRDAISSFLLSSQHSPDKPRKQRIRDALLLYHPDRFDSKYMSFVSSRDKDVVKEAVGRIARALNALAEEGGQG